MSIKLLLQNISQCVHISAWLLSGDEITSEFWFFIFVLCLFSPEMLFLGLKAVGEDTAEEVPIAGGAAPDDTQYPSQLQDLLWKILKRGLTPHQLGGKWFSSETL